MGSRKEVAHGLLVGVLALVFISAASISYTLTLRGLLGDDEPKVAVARPPSAPSTVYVLQSFYDDLTFVDGVFSSPDEAEAWIEGTHGPFERSGRDGIFTYEAGDFTYLVTPYEVDDRG